jgi:hypothetical protein
LKKRRFTTRFARGTEAQRRKCFTNFNEGEYPLTKIRETPLEGRYRGGGVRHFCEYLLFLQVFLQETVAFILATVFPWTK